MTTPKNERAVVNPSVWVWVTNAYVDKSDSLRCLSLEINAGQIPSRGVFMQVNGRDVTGPIVMKPPGTTGQFKHGMRVMVKDGTRVIFAGWLLKRSDQGRADKIIWQAFDDRVLLQWIAMRGAIVYDPIDKILRYAANHPLVFNPDGFWNCTGFSISGTTYPVFTNVANKTQSYESPSAQYPTDPVIGAYNPWTPRRALKYLALWAIADVLALPGLTKSQQSFLNSGAPLEVSYALIAAMRGYDPGQTSDPDPLDYKINSTTDVSGASSIQGQSMFNAFGTILGAAGTHSMIIKYDQTTPGKTYVDYKVTGYYPLQSGTGNAIVVQNAGNAGETLNAGAADCWDFTFDEDASQICETSLVEGDVIKIESSLSFVGGCPAEGVDYSDDTTSDIIPAWTRVDEKAFLECISGAVSGSFRYAKIARVFGAAGTLDLCDGSAYPKKIPAFSPEAIQAARDSFPNVFRAWKLNSRSTNMQHLLSQASGGTTGGLKGARPMLPEQLQFLAKNLGGGSGVDNALLCQIPIRVRYWNDAVSKFYEVAKDVAFRVTGDGLIWFDGLAEGADLTSDCMYNGSLLNAYDHSGSRIVLRKMTVNCAFPSDTRVVGLKTVPAYANPDDDPLDNSIRNAFATDTGRLGRYQDMGKSFRRMVQHESYPCLTSYYYGGADGTSELPMPLSRDLPPGDESPQALLAAQRILARHMCPRRNAVFYAIGINTSKFVAGDRIDYVVFSGPVTTLNDWNYYLRGPIMSITHDFQAQLTTWGGVFAEFGSTTGA